MLGRRPLMRAVVGFGEGAQFKGAALKELERLREHDVVRLIDLLAGVGGLAPADEWLHPEDLVALGIEAVQ